MTPDELLEAVAKTFAGASNCDMQRFEGCRLKTCTCFDDARAAIRIVADAAAGMAKKYAEQNGEQAKKAASRISKLRALGLADQADATEISHLEMSAAQAEAAAIEHAIRSLIPPEPKEPTR